MSKILSFISKANQILLFIVILGVIIFGITQVWLFIHPEEKADNKFYKTNEAALTTTDKMNMEAYYELGKKIGDSYLFVVRKRVIPEIKVAFENKERSQAQLFYVGGNDHIVNFYFKKAGLSGFFLYEKDVFILDYQTAIFTATDSSSDYLDIKKNIYVLAESDKDENGILDHNDNIVLFVSDYDGKNLIKVIEYIDSYNHIDNNVVVIIQKDREKSVKKYFEYNLIHNSLRLIDELTYSVEQEKGK
ncbi:MAG: hypothetical protein JXR70_08455 [Spirochaetales bacterium]|nr:hypothetical protein [Spirochaetales bacterium]